DVRIHCYDVRTVSGVRDYRDRCGIHDKALEMVEMASQRIGQNRFNDVSVTDRGPHGTFTVTGIELGGARTYGRSGAKIPVRVARASRARCPASNWAARARIAATARDCMLRSDSPPGNTAAEGCSWIVDHSGSPLRSESLRPCQWP